MALHYAMERKTFGKTIAEHQAIQLKLAEMSTRAAAAELLVHQAADKFDRLERCDLEAGQAKFLPLRRRFRTAWTRCECLAAIAIRRNTKSSGFTETRHYSVLGRAPTRFSA
jgi:alkylation response protein AidB-like acyl-CoA dehydrogenase